MNEWPDASFARRAKFIKKMAFAARSITVTKFVTAGAVYNNKTSKMHKNIRDQVFSAYVMRVLHLTRIHGIIPRFAFDQVQRGKRSGWADECMTGIRRSPFFIWASKGAHIEPIQYVEPGATLESKIADCLAFVTAREFARRFSARDVDVNSKWFGHTHYSGFNGRGDLIPRDGVGFPWKAVFGLNEGR